jgi:tetratricopeptide (TPR) repeat protein
MPARFNFHMRALALAACTTLLAQGAFAQTTPASQASQSALAAPTPQAPAKSRLDRQLFLQLLIGEIELREGEVGTAYEVILEAARRSKEEQLFKRATDIALQAGAGEQALTAAKTWREDVPDSLDAHRYVIQILVALNRPAETVDTLSSLVKITPEPERPSIIMNLPRFFSRVTDRKATVALMEKVLQPYADQPATKAAVSVAIGHSWFLAEDNAKALEYARRAHEQDPASEGAALFALEMLPGVAPAEDLVLDHLKVKPTSDGIRQVYARILSASQRFADAAAQLEQVTQHQPQQAGPYLTLGALYLELKQPAPATAALKKYIDVAQSTPPKAPAKATTAGAAAEGDDDGDDDASAPSTAVNQGVTQAWLMLAQAAEQQGDFKGAEAWLAKVDNPQRALEVIARRASLMARQGKIKEARDLIHRSPEKTPDDARAKLLAEAQVLRDVKHWADANSVLATANKKFPDDVDLLYEQSMMAEKLNKLDEMEKLLRRVIEIKPDHQHAYNALGYSLAERNTRLPEAKALIQKALEIAPGEPFITDSLGWVEYRSGNRVEALRLLRGAYRSRPDPEIAAHLGEVLWINGDRDEAKRVWREARSKDSANDVLRETLARLRVGDL